MGTDVDMGTDAIQEWQRGVVAIGGLSPFGGLVPTSAHVTGSGFIVDLPSGLVVTCAHVVLAIYKQHLDSNGDESVDPGGAAPNIAGLAIGVGVGERIIWKCRAKLRYISRPPPGVDEDGPVPPDH